MDEDNPAPQHRKQPTEQQAWVGAVCAVTGWNVALMAGRAGKLVKALRAAGGSMAELLEHYGQEDMGSAWWWYRDDWRGKKLGQRPDDAGIRATWGAWNLPIAVAPQSAVGQMLAHIEQQQRESAYGNSSGS